MFCMTEILRVEAERVRAPVMGDRALALRAMVCGGGGRFGAFARDAGGEQWRLHDESGARPAGDWAAVLTQCRLARMQPLVLLYDSVW